MTPRVLLVEDDDERAEWMGRELAGVTLDRAADSAHALAALEGGPAYDVIMLDYDIDPDGGGGHHVVAHLQQRSGSAIIIVHSANPLGGPWMAFALKRAGYETTYAPVFDPESPDAWRSILGGEPVIGEWGCPSSHPALSLSKKGECALCVLAPKTHWYYEDDQCVLLDCLTCGSPMLVSKHHDEWTDDELADLIELATEGFPGLQPRLRRGSIPDHPHFHLESPPSRQENPSTLEVRPVPPGEAASRPYVFHASSQAFDLVDGGTVVGTMVLTDADEEYWGIEFDEVDASEAVAVSRVDVFSGRRGKGYLRQAVAWAEAYATALGRPWLILRTDPDSVMAEALPAMYGRLGFVDTYPWGEGVEERGVYMVKMANDERLANPNIQAMGMCFPFAYQKAEEWFEAHTEWVEGHTISHRDLNDKSKFKVVHGTVTNKWESPPKAVVHGWVEMGDVVFDDQTKFTKPDGIPRDVYYDNFQPEPYAEFTAEEAIDNCIKYGGEGPWDEQLFAMQQERDAWMHEGRSPNPRSSLTPQAIKKLERRFRKGVKLWRGVGGTPRDPGDLGIGTYHSSYRARARQYADSDLITPTVRLDAPLVLGDEDAYTQIADRYGTVRAPGSRRRLWTSSTGWRDPRRWGLRERTLGAIQATVDMIEAGYDGLVSVDTLTGGLEVVVFPALEEIRHPNATDAELQAEVDAEIEAMVAERALKGPLEPEETPTHSPPSGEINPDYSRTLKPWEDPDHLDVHAFADYYGITLRPRIETEGPHKHGQYRFYDCGSHAERIFTKKWGYLGWRVGTIAVPWEEAQQGDEVVWGQGWHRGVVVDPSRKLVESCWGVGGYVFQHPVDIGQQFFGEAQVFPVTSRAGE